MKSLSRKIWNIFHDDVLDSKDFPFDHLWPFSFSDLHFRAAVLVKWGRPIFAVEAMFRLGSLTHNCLWKGDIIILKCVVQEFCHHGLNWGVFRAEASSWPPWFSVNVLCGSLQPTCSQIYLFHLTPPCWDYLLLPERLWHLFPRGNFHQNSWYFFIFPFSED